MQSLWMLVAALLFSMMGVGVKLASATYSTAEIVAYRGLIGVLLIWCLAQYQAKSLTTKMPGHHLWRGAVGVFSLWLWFYAIKELPLALAVTLNYTSPIWLAVLLLGVAWFKRGQRPHWRAVGAILLSFVGVIVLLRPDAQLGHSRMGMLALSSGMLAALAYWQVRQMGVLGEPEYRVVFYFSLVCTLAGAVGASVGGWHTHAWPGVGYLLLIGVTAASAQMAMTRAYRLGKPLLTANLQYVGIVFASMWDVLLWNIQLDAYSWLGITIILTSGILATLYNRQTISPTKS